MTVAQTISCSFCSLSRAPENRSFALPSRAIVVLPKCREQFAGHRRLRSLRTNRCFLMNVVVRSSVDPAGLPSGVPLPPGSWKMWLLGMVISGQRLACRIEKFCTVQNQQSGSPNQQFGNPEQQFGDPETISCLEGQQFGYPGQQFGDPKQQNCQFCTVQNFSILHASPTLISAVLPFWKSRWGPLLKLKNEVETVVEIADHVAEVVEQVAEGVEKVAEDVAEMLPEGGKLRSAVEFIEHVAEETAKGADLVDGFLDKAEELEKEVEEGVESLFERPKPNQPKAAGEVVDEVAKEAADEPEVAKVSADEPEVAAKVSADEPASSV